MASRNHRRFLAHHDQEEAHATAAAIIQDIEEDVGALYAEFDMGATETSSKKVYKEHLYDINATATDFDKKNGKGDMTQARINDDRSR